MAEEGALITEAYEKIGTIKRDVLAQVNQLRLDNIGDKGDEVVADIGIATNLKISTIEKELVEKISTDGSGKSVEEGLFVTEAYEKIKKIKEGASARIVDLQIGVISSVEETVADIQSAAKKKIFDIQEEMVAQLSSSQISSSKGSGKGKKKAVTKDGEKKCGACMHISRICKPDCPYRQFFPPGTQNQASFICQSFTKENLFEIMKKCKTGDQRTKCRANLFNFFTMLEKDPVNTQLEALDDFQEKGTTLAKKLVSKHVCEQQVEDNEDERHNNEDNN